VRGEHLGSLGLPAPLPGGDVSIPISRADTDQADAGSARRGSPIHAGEADLIVGLVAPGTYDLRPAGASTTFLIPLR
jgi:hypothetical protein